jgi:hypothetical protein
MTTADIPPIDFRRYPLDTGDSGAAADLIAASRAQLDRQQYCSLPGFFRSDAIRETVHETLPLLEHANRAESWRNCYLQRDKASELDDEHPRNIFNHASYRMIAADLFGDDSALKRLYYWPPFQRMVAAIVGVDRLYPSEDPLQPVNVICYGDGDQSAWHYDSTNAFTMTLMLQPALDGGLFELAPNTRNGADDEDIAYMQEVLRGDRARVETVSREAGELTIFRGCNSLHRVSPVVGEQLRMMAVFVYEDEPGIRGDPEVNLTVYGRSGLD